MWAKELMIGDWVRMRRIDVENATYYTSKVLFLAKDGFLEYEPIPLTEEGLKKNGFVKRGSSHAYIKCYRCYDIYVDLKYNDIEISKIYGRGTDDEECDYACDLHFENHIQVHQLQHALRLFGLNELADNFKVE